MVGTEESLVHLGSQRRGQSVVRPLPLLQLFWGSKGTPYLTVSWGGETWVGGPWCWPLLQVDRGWLNYGMAWPTVGQGIPPCCPLHWVWGSLEACLLCYSAEQLVQGTCGFTGVAVKLFAGEVGAGSEAETQPWPGRRRKTMTIMKEACGLGVGCWWLYLVG